jgi:uncharacterized membrane protein YgdD (TMEM256/DUF423 family)
MHKNYLVAAAIFGGLAVALGAFGAHGLERMTSDEKILHGFQTGVQYQMYHAFTLMAVAVLYDKLSVNWMKRAGMCFIAGIISFSGSLYLLTFLKIQDNDAVRFLGPVTPVGGLFLIAGWICLLIATLKKK